MKKKLRIVLDTNVLVSGMFWYGASQYILKECKSNNIELILSPEIISEFEKVLRREKKFEQTEKTIAENSNTVKVMSKIVIPKEKIEVVKKDSADNKILECAVTGNIDYIVSGDMHLLELRNFRGIKIVTPREMLENLRNRL